MSEFKPQHGKRCVMRDGTPTDGPVFDMRLTGLKNVWAFRGAINGVSYCWTESGKYCADGGECERDLVAEYVPPPEQKWVPFDMSDFATCLFGKTVVPKDWHGQYVITDGVGDTLTLSGGDVPTTSTLRYLLNGYTFADGTPCGKQVPQ